MIKFKRTAAITFVSIISLYLTACGGAAISTSSATAKVPFGISFEDDDAGQGWSEQYRGVRLDVIVPIFDPNIPEDSDQYEKLGIWPELRNTEAIRFAVALRDELDNTNVFADVRATPDVAVSGDLYVTGKILESNGEDVKIAVEVHDISGARWMKKTYEHRVKEYHWQNIRQSGKDPYQPVFQRAATDIAALLKKKSEDDLTTLRAISEIQFASAFSHENFAHHLEVKNRRVKLVSLPAVDDPMLVRTRAIRILDGQYMDKVQDHYDDFVVKTAPSYVSWQEHSMASAKAQREAKAKSAMQAIGAALLLFGAAAAADNSSNDSATNAAIAGAAVGGVMLMQKSFASNAEGKYHRDNLMELGSSMNLEVAPQVVQFENETFVLQGDLKSQLRQWQTFLKSFYELEATPSVQL